MHSNFKHAKISLSPCQRGARLSSSPVQIKCLSAGVHSLICIHGQGGRTIHLKRSPKINRFRFQWTMDDNRACLSTAVYQEPSWPSLDRRASADSTKESRLMSGALAVPGDFTSCCEYFLFVVFEIVLPVLNNNLLSIVQLQHNQTVDPRWQCKYSPGANNAHGSSCRGGNPHPAHDESHLGCKNTSLPSS